jgi:hypothetical protein
MRITTIVLMALVCVAQTACVSQHETIPPGTRAELIRLGRIIIDKTRGREERKGCMTRFREIICTSIEEYGPYAVSRRTIVEALNLDDDSKYSSHLYSIDNGNDTYYMLIINYDNRYGAFVRRADIDPEATT